MKAMILAAGLGTRLRPLTGDRPKALVEVAGRTMLEIALCRLRTFGVHEVIVNAHHHGDMLAGYLRANDNFGMNIEVSCETELLDTGGGLKKAAYFFTSTPDQPFILHNVDVVSTIDLARMMQFHRKQNALVTLAVQDRATSRYLLFDEQAELCGRRAGTEGKQELVPPAQSTQTLAFSGIHVLSPRIFEEIEEEGAFSIVDLYLRLAAQGDKIVGFRTDEWYWRDLGRPESIVQAERDIAEGKLFLA
jgi:NDP-sugar pyrophosphorylase family protein